MRSEAIIGEMMYKSRARGLQSRFLERGRPRPPVVLWMLRLPVVTILPNSLPLAGETPAFQKTLQFSDQSDVSLKNCLTKMQKNTTTTGGFSLVLRLITVGLVPLGTGYW